MFKLIHLFFNYQPGLVSLELTQTKDQKIFQNEKLSQTLKNALIKVIKLR